MSDASHFQLRNASSSDATLGISGQQICTNGDVQHVNLLSDHIGALCGLEIFSDVTLKVEGERFPAHRIILAARSEYFRAMFYGGMKEETANEVELRETPINAFKILLKYIYTSTMCLTGMREELVVEILGLAHIYGFSDLETAIAEYLKTILNHSNLCSIFNISQLYGLKSLTEFCLAYADRHAGMILNTQGFLQLSSAAIEQLLSRDSFCAPETVIFGALQQWIAAHSEVVDGQALLRLVRLPLISLDDLLNVVRPSGLLASDAILDAIKEQNEKRTSDLTHRGVLLPNINVASGAYGATVIAGESPGSLMSNEVKDSEWILTRHNIGPNTEGIVIELANPFILNHLILSLWDREPRMYSYYVEVSVDSRDWVQIVNYDKFLCRSKQNLYFPARAVKYIRVMGTHNSVNKVFHLTNIQAMYVPDPPSLEPATNIIIPSTNIATIENNALVIEGVSRCRNALLNGETTNYDWDSGYTCHQLGSGAITVQLPQPYLVSSMRLLLWDCDDRYYSYYVEVSQYQGNWFRVIDKTAEQCRSWQLLEFPPIPVVFIRIIGTHNSANEVFHCVHFECPAVSRAPLTGHSLPGSGNSASAPQLPLPPSEPADAPGPSNQQAQNPASSHASWQGVWGGGGPGVLSTTSSTQSVAGAAHSPHLYRGQERAQQLQPWMQQQDNNPALMRPANANGEEADDNVARDDFPFDLPPMRPNPNDRSGGVPPM